MDPQAPPTAATHQTAPQQPQSPPHTHAYHGQRSPETNPKDPNEYTRTYSEKEPYAQSQAPRSQRGSKYSNGRSHDSVISHPLSHKASSPPSPSSSISSARRKHRSSEQGRHSQQPSVNLSYPPPAHLDPEKGNVPPQGQRSSNRGSSNHDVTAIIYDSGEYHEKGPEEKPVLLLLYLSGPCAALSFIISLWTLAALLLALLLQPLRLCTTRPTLSSQLTRFLAPPLNLQLHLIYSYSSATDYSPAMLVVIHLFSPLVSAGVAIAAWTAAFFWFFSAILGDPAGQDGRNDGKECILGVRNWWDRWLSRGLR